VKLAVRTHPAAYLACAVLSFGAVILPEVAHASNYALEEIPGMVPAADAARLKGQGITTTFLLLEKAGDPEARKSLAKKSKITLKTLEGWVQLCDLMRIKGVGPDVARLLSAAGARTVEVLKSADPTKLNDEITKVNSSQRLSENPPSIEHLGAWIAQAKTLPIVLH
jgi:predicted flap endonuclease-1-like 5' DNA nuclease